MDETNSSFIYVYGLLTSTFRMVVIILYLRMALSLLGLELKNNISKNLSLLNEGH